MFSNIAIGNTIRYYVGDAREAVVIGKGTENGNDYLNMLQPKNGHEWKVFDYELVDPYNTAILLGPISVKQENGWKIVLDKLCG